LNYIAGEQERKNPYKVVIYGKDVSLMEAIQQQLELFSKYAVVNLDITKATTIDTIYEIVIVA
jgi:hypothetical protein